MGRLLILHSYPLMKDNSVLTKGIKKNPNQLTIIVEILIDKLLTDKVYIKKAIPDPIAVMIKKIKISDPVLYL